jgi:hypothetical protein
VNVHFRNTFPEAVAIKLMRNRKPRPAWLSKGKKGDFGALIYSIEKPIVDKYVLLGWPKLSQQNVESFHKMLAKEIKGPARLYRIMSPNSRAMGDCWVSEEVFKKLQNAANPRDAWRKYLAVWPDWNVNGQFAIYDVKAGEKLKVWRGPASSQAKDKLDDAHLGGGWEQVIFNVERGDHRNDTMRYYLTRTDKSHTIKNSLSQKQYDKLSKQERAKYSSIRESINHPNISGPFETGWGYTDFENAGPSVRVGLPALPGQVTENRGNYVYK